VFVLVNYLLGIIMSYLDMALDQIENKDSKDDRWDKDHYLLVAKICGCRNCYSCAVQIWNKRKQYKETSNVI
jgi:hypothetical protein